MYGTLTSFQQNDAKMCRWGIDASDPRWGDGHYYNYGGDCLDPRVYPRSKFVSEFGFQSYPSFSVLKQYTAPQDWSYTSPMMNYRCASRSQPSGRISLTARLSSFQVLSGSCS